MDTEKLSGLMKLCAIARTEEPVIADVDESVRPPVRQETTTALLSWHGTALRLPGGRFLIWACHLPLFQGQDTVVASGHPANVWGQLWQGFDTPTDGLTVDHPSLVPGVWWYESEQRRLVQRRAELGTEHHGERLHGDQAGRP